MVTTRRAPPANEARADGRVVGKVTDIKQDKGFGFIVHTATGEDYFFHKSECLDIFGSLQKYDTVIFLPGEGPKGRRATQVERP